MTTATRTEDNTSVEPKGVMSFEEAVSELKSYEVKLSELAKNRLSAPVYDPDDNTRKIGRWIPYGISASSFGVGVCTIVSIDPSATDISTVAELAQVMLITFTLSFGAIGAIMPGTHMPKFLASVLRQKRINRAKAEYALEKHIYDKSEKTYHKQVGKILKKAKPALDVVNANTPDGKLEYMTSKGRESFALIQPPKPKNVWERLEQDHQTFSQFSLTSGVKTKELTA